LKITKTLFKKKTNFFKWITLINFIKKDRVIDKEYSDKQGRNQEFQKVESRSFIINICTKIYKTITIKMMKSLPLSKIVKITKNI